MTVYSCLIRYCGADVFSSVLVLDSTRNGDSETIRLATGLLLPIWSALPSDHLVVNRIADGNGQSWLGRLVFDDHVPQLFTKLGIDRADNLPPQDIAKSALAGRSEIGRAHV